MVSIHRSPAHAFLWKCLKKNARIDVALIESVPIWLWLETSAGSKYPQPIVMVFTTCGHRLREMIM
jgi:hypothetical protein